jgi:hypothetical protein
LPHPDLGRYEFTRPRFYKCLYDFKSLNKISSHFRPIIGHDAVPVVVLFSLFFFSFFFLLSFFSSRAPSDPIVSATPRALLSVVTLDCNEIYGD